MVTKKKKGHLPVKKTSSGEFLTCQGYTCKYFCSEEEWRNLDKRLIPLNGDPDLLVDRLAAQSERKKEKKEEKEEEKMGEL